MTAEELIQLPRGRFMYELVKGELLTMSPPGEEHGAVIINLAAPLAMHVKANKLGIVYAGDPGFILERDPDTVLGPDIAFISHERAGRPGKGYRSGPPDLAVEVISPKASKKRIATKTAQWLEFGTLVVWLVNPETRTVEVIHPKGQRTVLSENDELTGGNLIPGFRIPVGEIFNF